MAHTTKPFSEKDADQVLQSSMNDVNGTIGVDGFLVGLVGRKIVMAITTTNVSNDTEVYTFSENGTNLYVLTIVYTDGTRSQMLSAERTA